MADTNLPLIKRTLSSANISAAEKIYEYKKYQHDSQYDQIPKLNRDVIKSSMVLPQQYEEDVLRLCVDENMLNDLQRQKSINWCESSRYVLPLVTKHDGNTCLHSISTYIFGVQDKDLSLRKLLYQRVFMEKAGDGQLYGRWYVHHQRMLQSLTSNDYEEYIIQNKVEWKDIIAQCAPKTFQTSQGYAPQYTDLNSFHIFTMANILGRVIIVLSEHRCDRYDPDSVKSSEVNGIYLPLLRNARDVEKSPIVIGYKHDLFVPLLSSENLKIPLCKSSPAQSALHCLPLIRHDYSKLPLKFLLPEEEGQEQKLCKQYFELCDVTFHDKAFQATWLKFKPPPAYSIELLWSLHQVAKVELMQNENRVNPVYCKLRQCARKEVINCPNYAEDNKENLCKICYEDFIKEKSRIPKRRSIRGSSAQEKPIKNQNITEHEREEVSVAARYYEEIPNVGYLQECSTVGCRGVGFQEFKNLCRACYTRNNEEIPNVGYLQECSKVGCRGIGFQEFKNLCRSCYTKTIDNPLLVDAKFNSQYIPALSPLVVNDVPPQRKNKSQSSETVSPRNSFDATACQNVEPLRQRNVNDLNAHQQESSKTTNWSARVLKKLFCERAGCESHPIDGSTLCEYHATHHNVECLIPECKNSADRNDLGLCLFCFRQQSHILRENAENVGRGPVDRSDVNVSNITRSLDLASIANSLPPQPEVSLPLPNIPTLPPVLPQRNPTLDVNYSPTRNQTPYSTSNVFEPPQVYEGFAGVNAIDFGTQHGVMNWQKERVSHSQPSSFEQKCLYCGNNAVSGNNGLCDRCFDLKRKDQKVATGGSELRKCVNDGCRSPGIPKNAYLCETCYTKQMSELRIQPEQQEREAQNQQHRHIVKPNQVYAQQNVPCKTKGCVRFALLPLELCDICRENIPKYHMEEVQRPVEAKSNQISTHTKCKGLGCDFFASIEFGGYCSSCFMEKTKQDSSLPVRQSGIRTYAPELNNEYQPPPMHYNSMPMAAGNRSVAPCRREGCDCFGRPEWDGYCSVCFRNLRCRVERDAIAI